MNAPESPLPGAARLILASSSPRRHMLLTDAGYGFHVVVPDIDEHIPEDERPQDAVVRLAREKARAVLARCDDGDRVLAADTVVVIDGDTLGKPRDVAEAQRMLLRLAGRAHSVFTGYALLGRNPALEIAGACESRVHFRPIDATEAATYAASGEPLDKAGAYALQGVGGTFVTHIEGSRSNVIGLPLETVLPLLVKHGVTRG